ncbi:MAG: hypothetical protein IJ511_06080 [Bacteroides sp.]|nr:hypothetical protein [Bacteroides sp.]
MRIIIAIYLKNGSDGLTRLARLAGYYLDHLPPHFLENYAQEAKERVKKI